VAQGGTDSGCVDQHHTSGEQRGRDEYLDLGYSQTVSRVAGLGDQLGESAAQLIDVDALALFGWPAVDKAGSHAGSLSEAKEGGHGSQGNNRGREKLLADKCIQQRAFPALELPQDRKMQAPGSQALPQLEDTPARSG
jgi:hypothetical protein